MWKRSPNKLHIDIWTFSFMSSTQYMELSFTFTLTLSITNSMHKVLFLVVIWHLLRTGNRSLIVWASWSESLKNKVLKTYLNNSDCTYTNTHTHTYTHKYTYTVEFLPWQRDFPHEALLVCPTQRRGWPAWRCPDSRPSSSSCRPGGRSGDWPPHCARGYLPQSSSQHSGPA